MKLTEKNSGNSKVRWAFGGMSLLGGLICFELLAIASGQPFYPRPTEIGSKLGELFVQGRVYSSLWRSLQNLFLGFFMSLSSGIMIGLLCGRYSLLERTIRPYVNALLTTPTVVFAPVYFALFGTSRWSIVGLIIHYSIFYLIVNTTTAVRAVDIGLIEMAKVFGADERQRMRLILLPSALPLVFASMRVAMARSVKGMINGEVLIAVVGLGAINQEFARVFDLSGVFAVASVVVAIAMFLSFVLSYLDRRINHWVPNARKS